MRLVVLRPEPGASVTVARAKAQGLAALARPLFRIEPVAWKMPDIAGFDGLLLTSANAVRAAGPALSRLSALPVYAVGEATATAACKAGLNVSSVGAGGVAALLESLPPKLRLLHLAGEHRTAVAARQALTSVTVYRSAAIAPPPDLQALAPAVVLVHSPRAGRQLAALVGDRSGFAVVAISAAAAAACGGGWASLTTATRPDDAELLSLAARLCQSSPPK